MTRIVLLGYGAMGRELERLSGAAGCTVVGIYDEHRPFTDASPNDYDVAIDFTLPQVVAENVRTVCTHGRNLVIGTTGWYDKMQDFRELQTAANNGVMWGSNFSVGVQMFFRLVRDAAKLARAVPEYNVTMQEWHHTRKKDSPSGTAITTRNIILQEIPTLTSVEIDSIREGDIVGKHVVTFTGSHDTIQVVHDAHDRAGFAQGALLAARWIAGRTGWFDYTEVFDEVVAHASNSSAQNSSRQNSGTQSGSTST